MSSLEDHITEQDRITETFRAQEAPMGADIHIVVEQLVESPQGQGVEWCGLGTSQATCVQAPGKKALFHRPEIAARDYRFFAALAGVRGSGPEPRGMPADASLLSRIFLSPDEEIHSVSFMSLHDFVLAKLEASRGGIYSLLTAEVLQGNREALHPYYEYASCGWVAGYEAAKHPDKFRVVFGFDN